MYSPAVRTGLVASPVTFSDSALKVRALGYSELVQKNKDYKIKNPRFVILSSNYKIVQVHKNLEAYKNSVLTPKP